MVVVNVKIETVLGTEVAPRSMGDERMSVVLGGGVFSEKVTCELDFDVRVGSFGYSSEDGGVAK